MSKDEIILPYKLEQHLVEICNSNATYANLLSVWNINKKDVSRGFEYSGYELSTLYKT